MYNKITSNLEHGQNASPSWKHHTLYGIDGLRFCWLALLLIVSSASNGRTSPDHLKDKSNWWRARCWLSKGLRSGGWNPLQLLQYHCSIGYQLHATQLTSSRRLLLACEFENTTRAQKTQYEIAHELGFYKPMMAKPQEFSMADVTLS